MGLLKNNCSSLKENNWEQLNTSVLGTNILNYNTQYSEINYNAIIVLDPNQYSLTICNDLSTDFYCFYTLDKEKLLNVVQDTLGFQLIEKFNETTTGDIAVASSGMIKPGKIKYYTFLNK